MMYPHFYCDACSNIYFDESLRDMLFRHTGEIDAGVLHEIESKLPNCPCGGHFSPGRNPKCPHCKKELANQADALQRLTDPYLILVQAQD